MIELGALNRILYSSINILPDLPIELGGKTFFITIIVMPSLVDYNILLERDYIYAIQVVVSSLFWIMTFPHEGCIITIDKLSYYDLSSHTSPNRTTPSISYAESIHYVSSTIISVDPTPIKCEPIYLVKPPHHPSMEVGWIHPFFGAPTSSVSPNFERNFVT